MNREASLAYDRLVRHAMDGRLEELERNLGDPELRMSERVELGAALRFQRGQLESTKPALLDWVIWFIWVDIPGGRRLVLAVLGAIALLVRALSAGDWFLERLRRHRAGQLVHHRYTNFVSGLSSAALLYAFASPETHPVLKSYARGLIGTFECLSGRFDFGVEDLQMGHEALERIDRTRNAESLTDANVYERYLSVAVLRGLYLGYEGDWEGAYRQYDIILQATATRHRYVLIEIFLFAMRMSLDLESLDARSLSRSVSGLKRLLGAHFAGKFGLRAAVSTALVATMNGDIEVARQQLALADQLYVTHIAAVELARFHLLRALVHLELGELSSASLHAQRANGFAAEVPGSRYHRADAGLLRLELAVRTYLRDGLPDQRSLGSISKAVRILSRSVRGSRLIALRSDVISAHGDFLLGRFGRTKALIPELLAAASSASPRLKKVLEEIDTRCGSQRVVAGNRREAHARNELSLMARLSRLVRGDVSDEAAGELFALILGASSFEVDTTHCEGEEGPSIRFEHSTCIVRIGDGEFLRTFAFSGVLVDARFDTSSIELLEVVAELTRLCWQRGRILELEKMAAVARTTQMLAHDVRKPFTLLRMILGMLRDAKTIGEVHESVRDFLPEVDDAIASVNCMLQDIMEISSEQQPTSAAALPEVLIHSALASLFATRVDTDIRLDYSLNHTHAVDVDRLKILRVFQNILGNALEAMRGKGSIWIRTRDVEVDSRTFVEFCLGNSGTFIAEDDISRIFNAFFTKGKASGTGLGLAIARKIVTAHGGRIWCRSSREAGVEFLFTLPFASTPPEKVEVSLPGHSSELERGHRSTSAPEAEPKENDLEHRALQQLRALGRVARVMIIDDEDVYVSALSSFIAPGTPIGDACQVTSAAHLEQACVLGEEHQPDLVILDVDLASQKEGGYSVAIALRSLGLGGLICMHSNRNQIFDYKAALEAGADAFIPKPMTRSHLIRLLIQSAEKSMIAGSQSRAAFATGAELCTEDKD